MPTTYAIPNGNQYFDISLWTGNTATQNIANSGSMQPDLVWIKNRTSARYHNLYNSVSGTGKRLFSNAMDAEQSITASQYLSSFNSNGFSLGFDIDVNESPYTYVGWQWKAGGAAVTNTNGSITSSVSANPTSGFSIVTYTGNGSTGTVGHGLSSAPKMIIIKDRTQIDNWPVYHAGLPTPATNILRLQSTTAVLTGRAEWNSTNPTSSVFSIGNDTAVNYSGQSFIAYCWSEVAGFSKFGSYVGNGSSDGTFVYTGFRPKYIMCKAASGGTGDWLTVDTARQTYNVANGSLAANLTNVESYYSGNNIDILSNGFKFRTSGGVYNGSGITYIYMAFAENPTKYANAR